MVKIGDEQRGVLRFQQGSEQARKGRIEATRASINRPQQGCLHMDTGSGARCGTEVVSGTGYCTAHQDEVINFESHFVMDGRRRRLK